jgi:tRNA(adenine34) deaminase
MAVALDAAAEAASAGEVPVGAVIYSVERGIVAKTSNRTRRDWDATAHAEILAIRAAGAVLGRWSLEGCTLYVTLEPCAMCAGAIVLSRADRVVFGAWDEKAGMGGSVGDILRHPRLNHRPQVTAGVMDEECGALLRGFFEARRRAVADEPWESL